METYIKEKIKEYLDKMNSSDIVFLGQILTLMKKHVQKAGK